MRRLQDGVLVLSAALMGIACGVESSQMPSDGGTGDDETTEGDGDSGDGDSGDGDSGDGDGDGDSGDGDGDSGDGDSGDGDSGDGDSGDGDSGDGDGDLECGVGGDVSISYSYIEFDHEAPNAEYHEVCVVASVTMNGNETTVGFDCPGDYHPGVVVTAQPMWVPSFGIGSSLDVHLEWLGKWSSGEWTYGTTWGLFSARDQSLVAALIDVHRWFGEPPLGMKQVDGVCEPQGWCDGPDGQLPQTQDVGLEFTADGDTITLFAGNSGQLGDYDIWVDEANYSACEDQLDSAPGLYRVFVAHQ